MPLNELYALYFNICAQPKTYNPIKVLERKVMRDYLHKSIHAELDSRIANKI